MKFNAIDFCRDYDINYITEGNNVSFGSIEIRCPFCDDSSFHGGLFITGPRAGKYSCWRCGSHWIIKVIARLVNVDISEAIDIYNNYLDDAGFSLKKDTEYIIRNTKCELPPGCTELSSRHKQYLINRGYNPEALIAQYRIKGTGYLGDYKFRIIIPVYLGGELVSYQGRDITDKQKSKYKNCDKDKEMFPLKHTCYGIDYVGTTGIIVEGAFDKWRWGKGAVCTFGINYTKEQVLLLASRLETAVVVYDSEEKAQEMANSLAIELASLGVNSFVGDIGGGDPDSLSFRDIKQLKKEWGFYYA